MKAKEPRLAPRALRVLLWAAWLCQPILPHPAAAASCAESAGKEAAHRYVEQCLQVSTASHPPCNVADPCSLIQDEIRRGCGFLGKDGPAFCQRYQPPK